RKRVRLRSERAALEPPFHLLPPRREIALRQTGPCHAVMCIGIIRVQRERRTKGNLSVFDPLKLQQRETHPHATDRPARLERCAARKQLYGSGNVPALESTLGQAIRRLHVIGMDLQDLLKDLRRLSEPPGSAMGLGDPNRLLK